MGGDADPTEDDTVGGDADCPSGDPGLRNDALGCLDRAWTPPPPPPRLDDTEDVGPPTTDDGPEGIAPDVSSGSMASLNVVELDHTTSKELCSPPNPFVVNVEEGVPPDPCLGVAVPFC